MFRYKKINDPMHQRYFVYLSYNGSGFHGWQEQKNALSVQEELSKVFRTVLKEEIILTGAGRTDTGVHARNYVAHFDSMHNNLDNNEKLLYQLNGLLCEAISIHRIIKTSADAHARFDATARTYRYYIHDKKDPFLTEFSYLFFTPLNIPLMNQACDILKEYHDFQSFCKSHSQNKTSLCSIYEAHWERHQHQLIFTIRADRFLRNMVRAIVGTMIEIGTGKTSNEEFRKIIEAKDRCMAGYSVPARGLFLEKIEYFVNYEL